MSKTARGFFESLDNPHNVGQSEYRLLHEHVGNLVDSADIGPHDFNLDLIQGSLEEVGAQVRALLQELARYRRGIVREVGDSLRTLTFASQEDLDRYLDEEFLTRRPSNVEGWDLVRAVPGKLGGWLRVEGLTLQLSVQMPRRESSDAQK